MKGRLFVFIEGNDDTRFFGRILTPLFQSKYRIIKLLRYSQQKHKKIVKFITSAKKIGDCIYVHDLNNSPCITARKEEIAKEFPQLTKNEIAVVVKEIEGWYLAGLSENDNNNLGINQVFSNTDSITRHMFKRLVPKGKSRIQFMQQILNSYRVQIAKGKNRSLDHFLVKWVQ